MDYETPQFYRLMEYARAADRDVVDLVSGSPDWAPPTAFREGLSEYADLDESAFDYGPSTGIRRLRRQIADRHDVAIDRVVVTNGAGEANHLAMAAGLDRFPGNEIVLTDPVYPYYAGRATLLDADRRFVPVDEMDRLQPGALADAVSPDTSVIVVNSPNNPTGAVYDDAAMAAFVEIAEDHDALLVSDEVYDRFDYRGRFASALGADSHNVVVTNAFSKSMAITGARVGYGIFPAPSATEPAAVDGPGPTADAPPRDIEDAAESTTLLDRARTRHMLTNVTGSRPAQYAVSRAIERTPQSYYADNRQRMAARIETFCAGLDEMGAVYRRPDGGFYVFASLPDVGGTLADAFELVDEAGVAAMPGAAFGEARTDYLRFAPLTSRYEAAIERLAAHLDRG